MSTINLTAENFESIVATHEVVLVDFWASWCGPCLQFAPVYDQACEAHPDLAFGKVDTEAERALSAAAGISSIPTLMVFREGVLVFSQPGALPGPALEQVIEAVRGLDMETVHAAIASEQTDAEPTNDEPTNDEPTSPEQRSA